MRGTFWRVGPRRVADGQGGGAAGVGITSWDRARRDAWWAGVRAGRAGGPEICRSGSSAFEATGERGNGAELLGLLESVSRWMQFSSLLGIVLVGTLCFALGASSGPPTVASAPAQFAGAADRVSLTVSKQMACQALRMKADRQKLEALRAKAESYAPGWAKSFERQAAELPRRLLSTDREQELADLDTGSRREREQVAWCISAVEFRWRRDSQGMGELKQVEGECGVGAQHEGFWRDNPGGACATAAGAQSRRISGRQGGGRARARPAGGGHFTSGNDCFGSFAILISYVLLCCDKLKPRFRHKKLFIGHGL